MAVPPRLIIKKSDVVSLPHLMNRYVEMLTVGKWRKHRGLENARELMKRIGDPQDKIRSIHVAGTNGKGSTAAYIASILQAAGYKVGLNTSPYLQVFNERIKINGQNIPDEDIDRYFPEVLNAAEQMEEMPTEFAMITALAFRYFAESGCDIAVIEVGMGGIEDATNVIKEPVCSVLTNIGLDHTSSLGKTLPEIAEKKAGIIKPGCDAVVYSQTEEVMDVFRAKCDAVGARYLPVDFGKIIPGEKSIDGQMFEYDGLSDLNTPLLGDHQLKNAVMAIEAVRSASEHGFAVTDDDVRHGIRNVFWPARFEVISKDPMVIIDGGHNGQCAETTRKCIEEYLGDRKVVLLTGIMRDKDFESIFDAIAPVVNRYICVAVPKLPRAMEPRDLAEKLKKYSDDVIYYDDLTEGFRAAEEDLDKDEALVIFGSLYLAGAVRSIIRPVR